MSKLKQWVLWLCLVVIITMNERQTQVQKSLLKNEVQVLKAIENAYKQKVFD